MNMEMRLSSWSVSRGCHLGQLERNLRLNPPFAAPRWKYQEGGNIAFIWIYRIVFWGNISFFFFFHYALSCLFSENLLRWRAQRKWAHVKFTNRAWPQMVNLCVPISFRFRPSKVDITRHSEGFSVVLSFHGCLPTTNRDSYSEEARLAPNARRQVPSQCL